MNKKLILVIGAMRSGKSYFVNKLLESYISNGRCGLVYNLGKIDDFPCLRYANFYTEKEHINEINDWKKFPEMKYYNIFEGKEKQKKLIKYFNQNFYGHGIKAPRLGSLSERLLFESMYEYCSNTMVVIDDARAIFRYGIKEEFLNLFSRINHSGQKHIDKSWKGAGCDVVVIFHSLDHVNPELLDYATDIVSFAYNFEPNFKNIGNKQLEEKLMESFKFLSNSEKYSMTWLDLETVELKKYKSNKI